MTRKKQHQNQATIAPRCCSRSQTVVRTSRILRKAVSLSRLETLALPCSQRSSKGNSDCRTLTTDKSLRAVLVILRCLPRLGSDKPILRSQQQVAAVHRLKARQQIHKQRCWLRLEETCQNGRRKEIHLVLRQTQVAQRANARSLHLERTKWRADSSPTCASGC